MKFPSQALAVLTSSLGLFSINFGVSIPAKASIVCEAGTISHYQNGSLATCILGEDMNVQVYTPTSGINNFECQAKKFISFDDKGQFKSCQISQETKLIKGNSVETCPVEYPSCGLSNIDLLLSANRHFKVVVMRSPTTTSIQLKISVYNYKKVLNLAHSINADFMVNAKINACSFSKNPSYVTA